MEGEGKSEDGWEVCCENVRWRVQLKLRKQKREGRRRRMRTRSEEVKQGGGLSKGVDPIVSSCTNSNVGGSGSAKMQHTLNAFGR